MPDSKEPVAFFADSQLDLGGGVLYAGQDTDSFAIPIALDEAVDGERIEKGDLVLLAAFGGGFTWGSMLIRWGV